MTTFSAAVLLVLLMAIVGSAFPAFRAMRVDPIEVIRTEYALCRNGQGGV